jgi:hypothetical protein
VRAVIALSLVVLFAILTVSLFSSLNSGGKMQQMTCLTIDEANMLKQRLRLGEVAAQDAAAAAGDAAKLAAASDGLDQLTADAAEAGHDFDTAHDAHDRAGSAILASVASG